MRRSATLQPDTRCVAPCLLRCGGLAGRRTCGRALGSPLGQAVCTKVLFTCAALLPCHSRHLSSLQNVCLSTDGHSD